MSRGSSLFQSERDAIVFLGLLSHMYVNWDPPVQTLDPTLTTQYHGYNIHAAIIDNADGEVLALKRNLIHEFESPVDHGEQLAVRAAIQRLKSKRPRSSSQAVEEYYRASLFYDKGAELADFLNKGCTLYTTLEPCPMCTATLLVCRMKRVVYVTADSTYGGSWEGRRLQKGGIPATVGSANQQSETCSCNGLHDAYYSAYQQQYEKLHLNEVAGCFGRIQELLERIRRRAAELELKKVPGTQFFDYLFPELGEAYAQFNNLKAAQLLTTGSDKTCNTKTLNELKSSCNIPF